MCGRSSLSASATTLAVRLDIPGSGGNIPQN